MVPILVYVMKDTASGGESKMSVEPITKVMDRVKERLTRGFAQNPDDVMRLVEELETRLKPKTYGEPEWWGKGTGD